MWDMNPFEKTAIVVILLIALSACYHLSKRWQRMHDNSGDVKSAKEGCSHKVPVHEKASADTGKYVMEHPYFFSGQDLSDCPTKWAFCRLLGKKVAAKSKSLSFPYGLKVLDWDNSHAMYVIARLEVDNPDDAHHNSSLQSVKAIEHWFWDPKNQMLRFKRVD